jgi:Tol biopolymer transport system component
MSSTRIRLAARRRRSYAAAALVAAAAGLLGFYGFNGGGATSAQDPPPPMQATDVFAQVRGWIVYTDRAWWGTGIQGCPACGDEVGIWAVDPTRPAGHASDRVQLRETVALPLDWSDDGTKLLIEEPDTPSFQEMDKGQGSFRLVILNADGTETTVLANTGREIVSASLSPDGSQVAYASGPESVPGTGIYVIPTDGGRPHLVQKAGRRQWYSEVGWQRTGLFTPQFSPDGTKIAYFDGMGDWGNGLRVMNADGSNVRVLLDSDGRFSDLHVYHPYSLTWSPDGSRLAFQAAGGIWVIGADGSGRKKVIPNGENPSWSPDGSRIAYQVRGPDGPYWGPLRIADADGGNVQKFTWGNPGPWNPLAPASH